jgi:hypothetical protein
MDFNSSVLAALPASNPNRHSSENPTLGAVTLETLGSMMKSRFPTSPRLGARNWLQLPPDALSET